jgi:hypothetical protein
MKRPNRTVSPGGTITFSVLDVRAQVVDTYVGTDCQLSVRCYLLGLADQGHHFGLIINTNSSSTARHYARAVLLT